MTDYIPAHPTDPDQSEFFRRLAAKSGVTIQEWFQAELISCPISGRSSIRFTIPLSKDAIAEVAKEMSQ